MEEIAPSDAMGAGNLAVVLRIGLQAGHFASVRVTCGTVSQLSHADRVARAATGPDLARLRVRPHLLVGT